MCVKRGGGGDGGGGGGGYTSTVIGEWGGCAILFGDTFVTISMRH